jgi:hypothetical protein
MLACRLIARTRDWPGSTSDVSVPLAVGLGLLVLVFPLLVRGAQLLGL